MAAGLQDEPGSLSHVFESAIAPIEKAGVWPAQRADEQVEFAVAIDVGEDRAARSLVRASHTGARGDIFELAVAEVAVERVRAIKIAEIEIAKTVSIEITGCDAGAVEEVLVRLRASIGKIVGEPDVCLIGRQQCKTAVAGFGHVERRYAIAGLLLPLQALGGIAGWGD